MVEIAALVLAAGRATRFGAATGTSKVLAPLGGRALVTHVVEAALASRARPVIVVTGQAAGEVEATLAGRAVRLVHNPDYASGMASSLRTALACTSPDIGGALVLLGDMPLVRSSTLDRLIDTFATGLMDAVVPTNGDRRGNPVLLGRALFPEITALRGDEGARRILADQRWRVGECAVDDPGIFVDVDTPAALASLTDREG